MNTRITGVVILACQWIQALAAAYLADILVRMLESFGARWPFPSSLAVRLTQLPVLLSITILLSAGLVATELFVKSERTRLRIQLTYFAVWTTVLVLVLASFALPILVT